MSRPSVSRSRHGKASIAAARASRAVAALVLALVVSRPGSLGATRAVGGARAALPKSDVQMVSVTASAGFATGFNSTYTLTVTNNGPQSAPGTVTVTDTLPAGLTFVSATPPAGWTCANAGQVVTCTLPGAMAKNIPMTFSIVATVTTSAAASVTNIATISDGANDDTNLTNNRGTATSAVTIRTVTSVPTTAAQSRLPSNGINYTDTYVVTNTGNVSDTYTLAASVVPAAGVATIISVNGVNGTTGTTGVLPVNGTSTVTVVYSVAAGAATGATAALQLTATGGVTATATSTGTVTVTVVRAGIAMSKQLYRDDQTTLVVGAVSPGEYVQYKVTVTNTGAAGATAVSVSDPVPGAVTHIANTPDAAGWTITAPPAGTITASLAGTLAASSSRYFWIRVRVK
jgi:uncharacterized repeat protein (TIGR01451 family)